MEDSTSFLLMRKGEQNRDIPADDVCGDAFPVRTGRGPGAGTPRHGV
jgi:hypothetical protein